MYKITIIILSFSGLLMGDDYSFNFDELTQIELKDYEYNGYIKSEHKLQLLNNNSPQYPKKNKDTMQSVYGEAYVKGLYFKDNYTFQTDLMANYENIDNDEDNKNTINQLFLKYKYDNNHQIYFGKKTSKWGKGYFFNPVAFIDRKKDPNNPESSREGYTQLNYKFNKVYKSDIKNVSVDVIYFRTTNVENNDFYDGDSQNIAIKTYLLYKDIDIDFTYLNNDKLANKYGVDFSTNLQTNFEIHGEYSIDDKSLYSYLLGLKYLTNTDLTITSEYFFQKEQLLKSEPFWDNKYFVNKLSQKEPFDILYSNIYYKNSINLSDNSMQNSLGIVLTNIKNLEIDFSIGKNSGDKKSEFGTKLVDTFSWLQVKYSF
ncbi:MAG: hypothetical protein U9R37_02825 [Campylobacterota bacterium]|nr:hypothetical protein [Campylobacterota bacterium]